MTDTRGCCEGTAPLTPAAVVNRPGRPALAYRIGTHGSFLTTMLARLTLHPSGDDGAHALLGLKERAGDDPAIALLDAWALVADVLTFYQERIANEGYLRTATERRSLLELARLVGYRPRPGVAASVFLAYSLDRDPDKDTVAVIPRGSRAQSVPGPGELPRPFETDEALDARYSRNTLKPRQQRPTRIVRQQLAELARLHFEGITTGLKANDLLLPLFEPPTPDDLLRVKTVTPEAIENRTLVTLQRDEQAAFAAQRVTLRQALDSFRDLEDAKVGTSAIAARVDTDLLAPLAAELEQESPPTPTDLVALLEQALPQLRVELAFVSRRGYGNLEAWLTAIVASLEAAQAQVQADLAAGRGPGGGAPPLFTSLGLANAASNGQAAFRGLGALIGALSLRPAPPPPHARDLPRSTKRLFASGSDLSAQLLVNLQPTLAPTLYSAWSQADFAAPSPIGSLQAFRLKAAPFGATLPPKPVLDRKGALVGFREWPLGDSNEIGVQIGYQQEVPQQAQLSVTSAGETATTRVKLSQGEQSIPLGQGSVTISFSDDPDDRRRIRVVFGDGLPERQVNVVQTGNSPEIEIDIDGDPALTWSPALGQRISRTTAERRIDVELADRPNDDGPVLDSLIVSDELITAPAPRDVITLDAVYDGILPDSWLVIQRAAPFRDDVDPVVVRRVRQVETVVETKYGASARATRLTLEADWLFKSDFLLSDVRRVTVHAQSEPLALVWELLEADVTGGEIELDGLYDGLQSGRWLIVSGERTDVPGTSGVRASELAMLAGMSQGLDPTLPGDKVHTTLHLAKRLTYRYKRATVTIWGNVVKATHGETRQQPLGSGDASLALPSFGLHAAPLTYLAAANPLGAESTLEVRVDEVRWREVDNLLQLGKRDRGYVTRADDQERTTVIFGNGTFGARPPTGVENITAVYRAGTGKPGNVRAEQISQLQTRPLGVSGVINPLPASGGAEREGPDQLRRNVPLSVTALDRLVSVPDYEDFALTRAGIGKASARRLSDGRRALVHLTIAGADDIPIDPTSDLYRGLRRALAEYGDPQQPFQVAGRELALIVLSARVRVEADRLWALVEPKVRAALLAAFSFERRALGQDVLLSQVISTIQAVPGVTYVDVDVLDTVPESITPAELEKLATVLVPPPRTRVPVELARFVEQTHTVVVGEGLTAIAAQHGLTLAALLRLNPGLTAAGGLAAGQSLVVFRGIKSAQLALLSPALPDTLILEEIPA